MDNPVGWFEIYVDDMQRAKTFYESVFGLPLSDLGMPGIEMWAFPMKSEGSGCTGSLAKMDGIKPGRGGVLIYFSVDDCAATAEKAAAAGGRIEQPRSPIGEHGFIALVADTEGNTIGLHSMK